MIFAFSKCRNYVAIRVSLKTTPGLYHVRPDVLCYHGSDLRIRMFDLSEALRIIEFLFVPR